MPLLLALLLLAPAYAAKPSAFHPAPPVAHPDTIAVLYGRMDRAGLDHLLAGARSVSEELLLRYRLYPLTRDARYLQDLPDERDLRSARDLALLSALWAYRVAEAPPWRLASYGRRSDALLQRARRLDPNDPYVLLVDGQSYLYRPGIFGGNTEAALERFVRLRDELRRREAAGRPVPGLPPIEAEVWVWYTLRKLGRSDTDRLRERLLAQDPPPLYRAFLQAPP